MPRVLAVIIVVLALVDGLIHLSLDALIQHSFTRSQNNVLFALCFVGYVVLVGTFIATSGSSLSLRRLINVLLIVYPLVTFAAFFYITRGRIDPIGLPVVSNGQLSLLGLAGISKPLEIVLAVVAALHFVGLGQQASARPQMARFGN
jgi:hypothetical protein